MSDIQTFEDLEVWKRGCNLAVDLHVALAESKDFALRNQMERSSLSIPSNIAEGAERDSTADFIKFLRYSKGSCGELRTQLYISERIRQRLNAPPLAENRAMIKETRELSRMLQGLINSLHRRLPQKGGQASITPSSSEP
ncbi:four helix bundle protein [Luteolibacter pohnpeiensis]|uniref:Four helix bundle protein n=1 Tax=Luteolibacter pohnpeiensis TaxID=454153 RepID=A0A934S4D1_9BACT|nr:four helix bundle protein [Luteolibacter pohnpeiensis]MBK1880980.1 four helix bundle protein [Luteolibacter pohnpeiensis]